MGWAVCDVVVVRLCPGRSCQVFSDQPLPCCFHFQLVQQSTLTVTRRAREGLGHEVFNVEAVLFLAERIARLPALLLLCERGLFSCTLQWLARDGPG